MSKAASSARPSFRKQPLAERVAGYIRANIDQGRWAGYLPGERELCREVSASRPVIRQALHRLRDEGYLRITPGHPTRIEGRRRSGVRPPSRRIVVLMSREMVASEFLFSPHIHALYKASNMRGLTLEPCVDKRLTRVCPDRILRFLVQRHRADHWVLKTVPRPVQAWFQEHGLPALVMGHPFPGIRLPFVDVDHRALARHAAGVFLRLGHRRIAAMHWAMTTAARGLMEEGLREACRNVPEARLRVIAHDGTAQTIRAHLKSLVESPQRPTALLSFHATDMLTILPSLLAWGLRVPEDVSLLTLTSMPYLDRLTPGIAYYQNDSDNMAAEIMRAIENPSYREGRVLLFPALKLKQNLAAPCERQEAGSVHLKRCGAMDYR